MKRFLIRRISIFILLLLSLSLPLWAYSKTVMVTIVDVGTEPPEEAFKEKAKVLENGLMDALFEHGVIFFTSTCKKSLKEMKKGSASLVFATESGADYLIEVSLENDKQQILYGIYDIEGKDLLKKGEISIPDGTPEEQKDFCKKTGMIIAKELYIFLDE